MVYEAVMRRLLVESKVDTLTRQIVRHIISACRSGHVTATGLKAAMDVPWPSFMQRKDGRSLDDIKLRLQIKLGRGKTVSVFVAGGWSPARNIMNIDVQLRSPSGQLEPEHLSQLQLKAYETVRHELEHTTQPAEHLSAGAENFKAASNGNNIWDDLGAAERYFTSPGEVEAFVAGIYHAAKRARMPFSEYADYLLGRYRQSAKSAGADPRRLGPLMRRIRDKWFAYASTRFPKAVIA